MKRIASIASFLLLIALFAPAQTLVRFVPEKKATNQPFGRGKIEQTGTDFSHRVRLELPGKTRLLILKPSPIKQYDSILTSAGSRPSTVDFFEASAPNQKYYLATINKRFHTLLMIEKGQFYSVEQTSDSLFSYQNITPDSSITRLCGYDKPTDPKPSSATNRHARLASSCLEFPVGFVCDSAYYKRFGQNMAQFEAANLLRLAASQEIWGPYAFDAPITFKAIGHIIYTNPADQPWSTDSQLPLSRIWGDFHNTYEKPAQWNRYKSLILVGLTGTNYGATERDRNTWGYAGGARNEHRMGTVCLKGYIEGISMRWLFAHELGHIFGAGHDTDGAYVMSDSYPNVSSIWSRTSKDAINRTLASLEDRKLLNECPVMNLTYAIRKDSLELAWKTNYDAIEDSFVVEYSSDDQKTWRAADQIKSKKSFSYIYSLPNKLSLGQVAHYRIRQQGFNSLISNAVVVGILGVDHLPTTTTEVVVYPNPVSNQLTLNSPTPTALTVYDLLGNQIHRVSALKNKHIINTSHWNAGLYLIRFDANPEQVYKVVK
ncbi:MAG: T9SS C-terminal target domain-containing protein [Cytophagales bacterium]|nr:MAG: T9SS C-terminal target domain-containing protein [Cytophagales bacterium]